MGGKRNAITMLRTASVDHVEHALLACSPSADLELVASERLLEFYERMVDTLECRTG